MTKFEYTASVVEKSIGQTVLNECNKFGEEGWELCTVSRNDAGDEVIYFKRVKE